MGFGEKDHKEVKCHSHYIISRVYTIDFLHYEVINFTHFASCALWRKSLCTVHTEEVKSYVSLSCEWNIYITYLKFCSEDLSICFSMYLFNYLFISLRIHVYYFIL